MLKNLVLIEDEEYYQFDTLDEVVKRLLGENYYNLTEEEKNDVLQLKAAANLINGNFETLNKSDVTKDLDLDNKFVLYDENTYILSLLIMNNLTMLENINSNIYVKYLNKEKFSKNYVIVNNFAKQILKSYLNEKIT